MRSLKECKSPTCNKIFKITTANQSYCCDNCYQAARFLKGGFWIVYGLPYEMYCGVTNQPGSRMRGHTSVGRNTNDWFILGVFKTKVEAFHYEEMMHNIGWGGRNDGYFSSENNLNENNHTCKWPNSLVQKARDMYVPGHWAHGGYGYKKIAKDLGVPESTVKAWLRHKQRPID